MDNPVPLGIEMIRPTIEALPASRIREVANAGIGRADILKFWFGEGDQVTPAFIRDAAKAALDDGETFYSHNLGLIELREALAAYANRLHTPAERIDVDRIAVTSAGVHALSLIDQALIEPGDRVVVVTPVWPNLTAMPRIMSAEVVPVSLTCSKGVWSLDLQRLLDAATARHPHRARQLAEQSDWLDDAAARLGCTCSRIAAGTASGWSATMRTSASSSNRR